MWFAWFTSVVLLFVRLFCDSTSFPKCDACQDRLGHEDNVRGLDAVEFSS